MQATREKIIASNPVYACEVNQAQFRVVNVSPFCIYLILAWHFHWQQVHTSVVVGAVGYLGYAACWFFIVCRANASSPTRRVIAAVFDQALPALAMYLAGFLAGYVAWVSALGSIGSGLRFGSQYTWLSVAVGAPLMSAAFFLSPEWRSIPEVAAGVVFANVLIPLYAVLLVKRFEERNQTLEQQAAYFEAASKRDALTGLLNRTGFMAALTELHRRAVEQEQKIAVLVLDLDGFKQINDTCGHAAGDDMLKAIATALAEALRDSDRIGRLGGDEFGIVLPNVGKRADVEDLATTLLRAIEGVAAPHLHLGVSASIGACLVTHHRIEDSEQIIAAADRLMYEAKTNGKKQFRIRD
jgi:diguanylate cyclase (GGDEF)-like protein